MKKAIAIIVLGLLWCENAYALKAYKIEVSARGENGIIYKMGRHKLVGSGKKYNLARKNMRVMSQRHCQNFSKDSYAFYTEGEWDLWNLDRQGNAPYNDIGYSVISDLDDDTDTWAILLRFFCASSPEEAVKIFNKATKMDPNISFKSQLSKGTGGLYYVNHSDNFNMNPAPSLKESKKVKIASMIDKAKGTCKSLGFKEGTEKFADCSLKLYSQEVEMAAEKNQTIIMQPQSSGSSSMTIYDPVRDSNALIRQGQRMLSGACTLGINC